MNEDKFTLPYSNEDDRAFGLAGMAIGMASLDALDRLVSVSLDSEGPMVTFSHNYYFSGSPSISPKTVWENLVSNFQLTSAMVLSNVMARSIVRQRRAVPDDVLKAIRTEMEEEGREECALELDEIDDMFDRTVTYTRRLFSNPRLQPAVEQFARVLAMKRTLSGRELGDELRLLQIF